jgi:hypothetical protein
MIYKTFEQWKSGNVLEHGVSRTEHYSEDQLDLVEMGWMYGYDAGRAVEQALDKKAENARELGLDYEPHKGLSEHMAQATNGRVRIDPVTGDVGIGSPPAQPAVQEPVAYDKTEMNCFVQELYDKKMCEGKHGHYETMFHCVHQAIKRVTPPAAQPAVPDAIHHTDLSEHPQYIQGWNDCRAEMLKGMKP